MTDMQALIDRIGASLEPAGDVSGDEKSDRLRDAEDERKIAAALTGRVSDWQGKHADKYRGVIERRVASCLRVAGCTWTALKQNNPTRYRRFLRGCSRAIRREAAMADGTLSLGDVAELRRRFNNQRQVDEYEALMPADNDDWRDEVSP